MFKQFLLGKASRHYLMAFTVFLAVGLASASAQSTNTNTRSSDFQIKEISEFAYLDDFDSAADFQSYIDEYIQACIDNTNINTKTISCFVGYKIWDRELNKYYDQLRDLLSHEMQALLLESQRSWIKDRDQTIELNSALLDLHYEDLKGTMFYAMRAGDVAETITPIVKQRALLLKKWVDLKIREPRGGQ